MTAPDVVLDLPDGAAWEAWLEEHHSTAPEVWLRIAKKGSGLASLSIGEALDGALCFGWIDGQRKALDDDWYLQRYTPRRARSRWSARNRARALELVEAGEMREPGHAEIERAQADGRWEAAYDSPGTIEVPHDLREALDAAPKAAALFAELDSQNRYAILYRVHDAKRANTRARRIAEFVAMLARGETPHPRRRKIERPPRAE